MQHCIWRYIFLSPFEKDSASRPRKTRILRAMLLMLYSEREIQIELDFDEVPFIIKTETIGKINIKLLKTETIGK